MARISDKINLPTNTTNIRTLALYLKAINDIGVVSKDDEKKVYAQVKIDSSRKNVTNPKNDTHTRQTLNVFGLIDINSDDSIKISSLGSELLEYYSNENQYSEESRVALMLKIFFAFELKDGKRDIHPGYIITKLLCDKDLNYQITNQELAEFVINPSFISDTQYNDIKKLILDFRNSKIGISKYVVQTKATTFLTTFVNNWGIFTSDREELTGVQESLGDKYFINETLGGITTIPANLSDSQKNAKRDFHSIYHYRLNGLASYIAQLYMNLLSGIRVNNYLSYFSRSNTKSRINIGKENHMQYLLAIKTKPFIILGGFSGTGKSQKVKELAYLTCPDELKEDKGPGNYCLISVKPNWHDSRDLLGFYSSINKNYKITDFMRFMVKAMKYPDTPFYCCLDEMNLALVEEYFAEYLSIIEDRKKINGQFVSAPLLPASVFDESKYGDPNFDIFRELGLNQTQDSVIIDKIKKNGLCLPDNFVVVGTVNMDDTTNSFSKKVIDRAMIFETDIERFSADSYFNSENPLQYGNADGKPLICDEVKDDQAILDSDFVFTDDDKQTVIAFINDINEAMKGTSFQISYRVLNETTLYYRSMQKLDPDHANLQKAMNDILMMKVLPRIEGDVEAKLALNGLYDYIRRQDGFPEDLKGVNFDETLTEEQKAYPWRSSYMKILYMKHLFEIGEGFTRFWK